MQTQTGTLQDEEQFDLDDVSGSEEDYEPPRSNHRTDANPTPQGGNNHNQINDPDAAPLPKTTAYDIHHFFDKSGEKVVCHVCRQVFLCDPLLFLN